MALIINSKEKYMQNIWKRILICLLVFIIVAAIALAITVDVFHQDGIHFLGSAAHIRINKKCYIMDREGNFIDDSMLRIDGYVFGDDFAGSLNIDAYPLTAYEALETGRATGSRGLLTLSGHGIELSSDNWTQYYNIHILRDDPDVIVIEIWRKDNNVVRAVCGETEEAAIANYQTYREAITDQ
jgi:hypothetical protein